LSPGAAGRSVTWPALKAVVCAWLLALVPGPAVSAPTTGDARREAVDLVQSRRCETAIPALELARRGDPGDARLPLLEAECQIRLQRYADALASLQEVKRLDPRQPELDLYFGIAHYHTGDLAAAEKDFEAARRSSPGRADTDLYLGLILLQRSEPRRAAEMLARARRTDADAVEPVASYYEGLAWSAAREDTQARDAFRRVQQLAPESDWAEAAGRALASAPGWGPRGSFVEASSGVEYNTNVTLAGSDLAPGQVSGRRDVDTMWSLVAGTEIYRGDRWSLGGLVNYYGNAHTKLWQYDLEYPGSSLWLDYRLTPDTTLRFQTEVNYAWYGYQPYQVLGAMTPQAYHSWHDYGITWAYAKFLGGSYFFQNVDYPDIGTPGGFGPRGVNEAEARNRDGWGITGGVLHTLPISALDLELRGGFNYYHYWSVGTEWRYTGYEGLVGFRKPLLWEFVLDGQAGFLYRPFAHPSTYPQNDTLPLQYANVDRRDNVWQFEVKLERPLTSWLKASFRYYYLDNGSNTAVYNYRQQIWGGYLTVSFRQR